MPDEPTYTFNSDGSVDITKDGKATNYVENRHLLAVKESSEAKERKWENEKAQFNTQLAETNRLRDETRQALLGEQAAKEQLVQQYSDYDTHKTRVGELETELGSTKEIVGKHETELTNRIRQSLLGRGASEEAIKDKTLDQLRNLEEAAKIFGNKQPLQPARYDGGLGGPVAGSVPEKPIDRAQRIIAEHEAKRGRPVQVSNAALK